MPSIAEQFGGGSEDSPKTEQNNPTTDSSSTQENSGTEQSTPVASPTEQAYEGFHEREDELDRKAGLKQDPIKDTNEENENKPKTNEVQYEEISLAGGWLTEKNVEKFQMAWKGILIALGILVLINILVPVFLRWNDSYVVRKSGCYGIDINEVCLGITRYSREIRKTAEFGEPIDQVISEEQ